MDKRPERKSGSEKTLRIVFSVVLIAAAVGLFLISDAGRALLSGGIIVTDAHQVILKDGTPGVTPEVTETPLPLPEDFIKAVSKDGPEGDYIRTQIDAYTADYTILRDSLDLESAHLMLSLQEGRVTAFMLVWDIPAPPEPPSANATLIEQDLYAMRCEKIEKDGAWLKAAFIAMAHALDVTQSVPEASLEVLYELADGTRQDGKSRSDTLEGYTFDVFVDESAGASALKLVFSSK